MEDSIQNLAHSDGVSVHTGFPNPAHDRRGQGQLSLDFNQLLVKNPSSTYLFRIAGHRWSDQGIFDGDVAVIDRALKARDSDLVLCWHDGFSLERQRMQAGDQTIWGVVTAVIHQFERE